MSSPAASTPVSLPARGVLAAGGSAIVHALVYHHDTPQTPPAALSELVEPIPADAGGVGDWRLSLRRLLAHRHDHVHDVWTAFSTWRATFVAERLVGDVATVRAFLNWADHVTDVTELHPLNLPTARIDPKVVPRVAWQVHEAEVACRARAEMGLGIWVPDRRGLVRGFVVGEEPLLLLAERGAQVSAVPSGLLLHDPSVPDLADSVLVHGWIVAADGVTAVTDAGQLPLGGTRAGRLLSSVSPGVVHASISPAPLTSVFSVLFLALRESARLAAADRVPLWFRTGAAH